MEDNAVSFELLENECNQALLYRYLLNATPAVVSQIFRLACDNEYPWIAICMASAKIPHIINSLEYSHHVCLEEKCQIPTALQRLIDNHISIYDITYYACKYENIDVVRYIIYKCGSTFIDRTIGCVAFKTRNLNFIKLFIKHRVFSWSCILEEATNNEDMILASLALENGMLHTNQALEIAYNKRNIEMIIFLIKKGATNYTNFNIQTVISILNTGFVCNDLPHYDMLQYYRKGKQDVVRQSLLHININGWDHMGLTGIVCDYVSY